MARYHAGGGILLVIIGHTIGSGLIRGPIFSFHMPLFFAVSGMTYKRHGTQQELIRKIGNSFIQLLIPVLVVFLIRIVFGFYGDFLPLTAEKIQHWLSLLLWSSGAEISAYGMEIDAIGMIWFLICLFLCRVLYMMLDYAAHAGWIMDTVAVIALIAGALLGIFGLYLPFSFDLTLVAIFFYHFGRRIRECRVNETMRGMEEIKYKPIIGAAIWGGGFVACYIFGHRYLEMALRSYPLFPVCIIVACAGILLSVWISQAIDVKVAVKTAKREKYWGDKAVKIIAFFGVYSLQLFIVHCLDFIWKPLYMVSNGGVNSVLRITIDCLICYLFIKAKGIFKGKYLKTKKG